MSDDEFSEIEYNEELEQVLQQAEQIADIEDMLSPFKQFRKKGWLSVSDLVGTVWCEVQYDYRLRTMPYLPPSERPSVIKTDKGKSIPVDKVKVEDKDRILKRGEKIHKRLEREIHPAEIVVQATTREDVWGLRFLNMLSALEALLTLGKCRELPVAGFVGDMLVMGIIDEVTRVPVEGAQAAQTFITSFFGGPEPATHKLYVSDSKTRASGTLPKEANTVAGQLQCMVYKQLLDALLLAPTTNLYATLFEHLGLDPAAPFSDVFIAQSIPVVIGNGLRCDTGSAKCLNDMVEVWARYVALLGLGTPSKASPGTTETDLELVYRRAGAKKKKKAKKATESEQEEEELAWAVQMSLMPIDDTSMTLPFSQGSTASSSSSSEASGTIIGRHRFSYNEPVLSAHLDNVLAYWMGQRAPVGVQEAQTNRCGWCEFEEGCEWREAMAAQAWDKAKQRKRP